MSHNHIFPKWTQKEKEQNWTTHQSKPSCKPTPFVAEVSRIAHALFLMWDNPKRSDIFSKNEFIHGGKKKQKQKSFCEYWNVYYWHVRPQRRKWSMFDIIVYHLLFTSAAVNAPSWSCLFAKTRRIASRSSSSWEMGITQLLPKRTSSFQKKTNKQTTYIEHWHEFLSCNLHSSGIARIDNKYDCICVRKVASPVWTNCILSTQIPNLMSLYER